MDEIVVSDRRVSEEGDLTRVTFAVSGLAEPQLWFEFPSEYRSWLTDSYDPAVVGLLLPAMSSNRNLRIEGPVSTRLAWFVPRTVMPLMEVLHKHTHPIEIVGFAGVQQADERAANAVAMGLSFGVDSTAAVVDYGPGSNAPEDLQLTHLIFNEVGAAGRFGKDAASELSQRRRNNVIQGAREIGLPLITMRSNVDGFQGQMTHKQTHDLKNAATPLLLQRGIRTFLYPSECRWAEIQLTSNSRVDPMVIPALSTENVTMRTVGNEHSRGTKTFMISRYSVAEKHLDICTRTYPNCSACSKCIRAITLLNSFGKLEQFKDRFDMQTYERFRLKWAVFARFSRNEATRLAAAEFQTDGPVERAKYYGLVAAYWIDRGAQTVIPGYSRFSRRMPARKVLRQFVFR